MKERHGSTIDLDPALGIEVEVVDFAGPEDEDLIAFAPKNAMGGAGSALTLRVSSGAGVSWLGRFEAGYASPDAVSTVTNGPDPDQLVVINRAAGFVLLAGAPGRAIDLNMVPVTGFVIDQAHGLVIVAGFTDVAAVSADGALWRAQVSWDGVKLDGVDDGLLKGRGWDAPANSWFAFEVAVDTGSVISGPTPRP